jgi:hypothetical protein
MRESGYKKKKAQVKLLSQESEVKLILQKLNERKAN